MAAEAHSEGGLAFHPLDQFKIHPLFGEGPIQWYTPTNVTFWLGMSILSIFALMVMGTRGRAVIPSRGQSMAMGRIGSPKAHIARKSGEGMWQVDALRTAVRPGT